MWTQNEISEISNLLNDVKVEDMLSDDEIKAIPDSSLANLRSRILEPKHKKPVELNLNFRF